MRGVHAQNPLQWQNPIHSFKPNTQRYLDCTRPSPLTMSTRRHLSYTFTPRSSIVSRNSDVACQDVRPSDATAILFTPSAVGTYHALTIEPNNQLRIEFEPMISEDRSNLIIQESTKGGPAYQPPPILVTCYEGPITGPPSISVHIFSKRRRSARPGHWHTNCYTAVLELEPHRSRVLTLCVDGEGFVEEIGDHTNCVELMIDGNGDALPSLPPPIPSVPHRAR
jgi:hypothetical protein